MRAIKTVRGFGYATMTYKELRQLGESLIGEFDLCETSCVNPSFDKRKGFDMLIRAYSSKKFYPDKNYLHRNHFENVIREFVLCDRKMSDDYKKIIIVKEKADFREEKLSRLLDRDDQ